MKFKQILFHLKKGKKVRRRNWNEDSYICLSKENQKIMYQNDSPAELHLNQLEADDWEIYKKPMICYKDNYYTSLKEILSEIVEKEITEVICDETKQEFRVIWKPDLLKQIRKGYDAFFKEHLIKPNTIKMNKNIIETLEKYQFIKDTLKYQFMPFKGEQLTSIIGLKIIEDNALDDDSVIIYNDNYFYYLGIDYAKGKDKTIINGQVVQDYITKGEIKTSPTFL